MSRDTLRSRFDKARTRAAKDNPAIKAEIEAFQSKIGTTEIYLRDRIGDKTSPTK